MREFREAVEAGDMDRLVGLLAEDVVFRSPVVFAPYRGRDQVAPLLHAVSRVFEGFRYTREIGGAGERDSALVFAARVGDREIEGCDFIRADEARRVVELFVMIRPLSALVAVAEAMRRELEPAAELSGAG